MYSGKDLKISKLRKNKQMNSSKKIEIAPKYKLHKK